MLCNIRFLKNQLVFHLISISLLIFVSSSALACMCAPITPEMAKQEAAVVFAGKVVAVEKIGFPQFIVTKQFPFVKLFGPFRTKTTFAVSQVWKGLPAQKFEITSCIGTMCCLEEFKHGDEVLIYSFGTINELSTGMCTGTKRLEQATKDLQILGKGIQILQNDSSTGIKKTFWSFIQGFAEFFRQYLKS